MNEQQKNAASQIFEKPSSEWTKDDWAVLDTLVKLGMRIRLKQLRQEVQNALQQAKTQT